MITLPQVIWGAPKFGLKTEVREIAGRQVLAYSVINFPEHRRFLQRFVRRETANDVLITTRVVRADTREVILGVGVAFRGAGAEQRENIHASMAGARCAILEFPTEDSKALILDGDGDHIEVGAGEYEVEIMPMWGIKGPKFIRKFTVGQAGKSGTTFWHPIPRSRPRRS